MIRLKSEVTGVLALLLASTAIPAEANFHLWFIKEAYTNQSGSVQFVELFTSSSDQEFVNGLTLTSNSHTFTFSANAQSPTTNHHLLFATAGFGSIAGGATPDYIIPSNFFNPAGDTLSYAPSFGVDQKTFASAPTDGINSLNYTGQFTGAVTAVNSPRNYAGNGTSVNLSAPEPATIACAMIGVALLGSRRFTRRTRPRLA